MSHTPLVRSRYTISAQDGAYIVGLQTWKPSDWFWLKSRASVRSAQRYIKQQRRRWPNMGND